MAGNGWFFRSEPQRCSGVRRYQPMGTPCDARNPKNITVEFNDRTASPCSDRHLAIDQHVLQLATPIHPYWLNPVTFPKGAHHQWSRHHGRIGNRLEQIRGALPR
jgi:hypothetical protein